MADTFEKNPALVAAHAATKAASRTLPPIPSEDNVTKAEDVKSQDESQWVSSDART